MRITAFLALALLGACDDGDIAFVIPEGAHDGSPSGIGHTVVDASFHRTLTFEATFDADTAYTTVDPANQGDSNKLMGISCPYIHEHSIRLGWRWDPTDELVELGFYGYLNGTRTSRQLTAIPRETWVPVEIEMWTTGMLVAADGESWEVDEVLDITPLVDDTTTVLETVYFGGDETAPHDVHVNVADIVVDGL